MIEVFFIDVLAIRMLLRLMEIVQYAPIVLIIMGKDVLHVVYAKPAMLTDV